VAIVTNSGGPGIMCADSCEEEGLELPELSRETRARLVELLPAEASTGNPVDMLATASGDAYRRTIETVAADPDVDAVIAIFTPALITPPEDVAKAIRGALQTTERRMPLLGVFISAAGAPESQFAWPATVPMFSFPEEATRALAHAVGYSAWRGREDGRVPEFADARPEGAAAAIASALARDAEWLDPSELAAVLEAYGIPLVESLSAMDAKSAGAAADQLGGPVALKAVAPTLVHKSEAHAVIVGLEGHAKVSRAAREMTTELERTGHALTGFVVQRLVERPAVEMLVGVTNDPDFGPLLACGAGGTTAELLNDVAVRLTPIDDRDASEMVRSLRTFPLLDGYRGAPPAAVGALEDILLRLSALVEAHPEIVELDLNPVMVTAERALVVDARARVAVAPVRPPWPSMRPPAPARR
jgi:acetate---CoA ligase (ADP-forming)